MTQFSHCCAGNKFLLCAPGEVGLRTHRNDQPSHDLSVNGMPGCLGQVQAAAGYSAIRNCAGASKDNRYGHRIYPGSAGPGLCSQSAKVVFIDCYNSREFLSPVDAMIPNEFTLPRWRQSNENGLHASVRHKFRHTICWFELSPLYIQPLTTLCPQI